jgi:hypothetical protein
MLGEKSSKEIVANYVSSGHFLARFFTARFHRRLLFSTRKMFCGWISISAKFKCVPIIFIQMNDCRSFFFYLPVANICGGRNYGSDCVQWGTLKKQKGPTPRSGWIPCT